MSIRSRLYYFQRILRAYLTAGNSQLSFWHDQPSVNPNFTVGELGEYYMPFLEKADYGGIYDETGIPMLDYHGKIGRQHNPIAIAQWGLGNYNQFARTKDAERRTRFCGRVTGFAIIWRKIHMEFQCGTITLIGNTGHRFVLLGVLLWRRDREFHS